MTCRHCALWDIESAKDKAGRVHKTWPAKCLWVSTEVYPVSIWRQNAARPMPGCVTAGHGEGCPCFTPREAK